MKIFFSPTPANNYHTISNYPYNTLRINQKSYPTPKTICFFHLLQGKFINGYDQNGKRLFSIRIPRTLVFVYYSSGNIKY